MPQTTKKSEPEDPLQRIAQLWPSLQPWQRAVILTHAMIYAIPAYQKRTRFRAHWVGASQ